MRSSALLAIAYRFERETAERLLARVAERDASPTLRHLARELLARDGA